MQIRLPLPFLALLDRSPEASGALSWARGTTASLVYGRGNGDKLQ